MKHLKMGRGDTCPFAFAFCVYFVCAGLGENVLAHGRRSDYTYEMDGRTERLLLRSAVGARAGLGVIDNN